jgi:hypothetical protein
VALVHEAQQLLEELRHALGLLGLPGDSDLVAPDEDVRVESGLNQLEELIPRSDEADHVVVARDEDLDLRPGLHELVR